MENKSGVCRFCGQHKIIEVPGYSTQEEIDEEVTLECRCEAAKEYQKKKQKEELMEMVKISAQGTIYELFNEDKPEIEQLLNNCIPLLVTKKAKKVTVNTGSKVTGTISIQKGTIKVERIEKSTYTRETEME